MDIGTRLVLFVLGAGAMAASIADSGSIRKVRIEGNEADGQLPGHDININVGNTKDKDTVDKPTDKPT